MYRYIICIRTHTVTHKYTHSYQLTCTFIIKKNTHKTPYTQYYVKPPLVPPFLGNSWNCYAYGTRVRIKRHNPHPTGTYVLTTP